MCKKYLKIVLPIILSLLSILQIAVAQEYYVVKNLRNDWQVYDRYYQSYIPLLTKETKMPSAGIFIQKKQDQDYYISFYSNKELAIFIENKLIYKHPINGESKRVRLPLKNINQSVSEDQYLLLFHNRTALIYLDSVRIETKLPVQINHPENFVSKNQAIQFRSGLFNRQSFILMIVVFCAVLVFYKFVFMKGRTLINVGLDRNTELLLLDRSGMMSVNLILINAILFMMIYYLISTEQNIFFNFPFRTIFEGYSNNYMIYLFWAFVFMQIFKVLYVKFVNELTFPSGVSPLQNYLLLNYLFQTGLLVLPLVLCIIALMPSGYIYILADYSNKLFFIILVIISVLTSYMIYSRSELRNIYLFSYICTAEIVPLIIAYRILLG